MTRPPMLLERLLAATLPKGLVGKSILGDLREEYRADLERATTSRARLRYVRKVLSILTRFVARSSSIRTPHQPPDPSKGGAMSGFWHDLRQVLRLLVRKPGLTLAAIVSLGLGIGANTAIFSLVNTILLQPLPYPDAHELVELFRVDEAVTGLNPTPERISNLWAVPFEVHRDWLEMGTSSKPLVDTPEPGWLSKRKTAP